ncbi:MAG: glutathione S-transferase family protein [Myxococcota bacterium]
MKLVIGDYALSSWSLRPWLALTVGGVPFETEVIRLNQPDTKARILARSPTGKVPALRLDDGTVVWESLAICEVAAEANPSLWPESPVARAVARSVACEMHAGFATLRQEHPMNVTIRTPKAPSPTVVAEVGRIRALWAGVREAYGAGGPFLFGRFSIADAMFAPVVTRLRTYAIPTDPGSEYCAAVWALPAMAEWERRAAAEVAGP